MADKISKAARSENMRQIRAVNTRPELALRRALWAAGLRGWRLHYKRLPGSPDFAFPRRKIAVFVDGCFWHGCPRHYRGPKSSRAYWDGKLEVNRARDRRTGAVLRQEGWRVVRLWEHDLTASGDAVGRIARALGGGKHGRRGEQAAREVR